MNKVNVIYGSNWLPFSLLICIVTFSRWSHCGLMSQCGLYVYESTFLKGVNKVPVAEFKKRYRKTKVGFMYCLSDEQAYMLAELQIGKKYDFLAVLGVFFKCGGGDSSKWLCSEYVAHCTQLFRSSKESSVTPEDCFKLTHYVEDC